MFGMYGACSQKTSAKDSIGVQCVLSALMKYEIVWLHRQSISALKDYLWLDRDDLQPCLEFKKEECFRQERV